MTSVNFAQPDVTLKLDLTGVIRRASLANGLSAEGIGDWLGRPWAETVSEGFHAQVRQMIEDARSTGVSRLHQVRQRFPSGTVLALEYTTVRLGGNAGLIAIGRSMEAVAELRARLLSAQKAMERNYWKLREVETRYRLLFDAAAQPVLLLSVQDTRIVEANPAAIRALSVASDHELLPDILPAERDTFHALLARVREQGKAPGIVLHLGLDRHAWLVRASLIAGEPESVFILQLSPSTPAVVPLNKLSGLRLDELLSRLPEAFVVLDGHGKILRTNRAFLELIEHPDEDDVLGQALEHWVSGPDDEAGELLQRLHAAPSLRRFVARLRGARGNEIDVELSAAGNTDEHPRYMGVLLRRVDERAEQASRPGEAPDRGSDRGADRGAERAADRGAEAGIPVAAAGLAGALGASGRFGVRTDLLGKATLREIVQETIAGIERSCIEAALELANGNRTAAAEMLGLSRQSLYAKLSRYAFDA